MARGRDAHTFRITPAKRAELIDGCSEPGILRDIFAQADSLAFKRVGYDRDNAIAHFEEFCRQQPCIIWEQIGAGIEVDVTRGEVALIRVSRVIWHITHVVSEQGPPLRKFEELLHSCGHNGGDQTSKGSCVNPAHLIKATADARIELWLARRTMKKIGAAA